MDDRHDETAGSEPSSLTPKQTSFNVIGRTSAALNQVRQRRPRAHSDYQPTGLYVTKGERLELSHYEESAGKISAVIGVPELNTPIVIDLNFGLNAIDIPQSGLLSFIYQTPGKTLLISIKGSYSYVPSFTLYETDPAVFQAMMDHLPNAPVVVLTSERAIIVVRYASALVHLYDPEKLMRYYDQVIGCQDVISGVTGGGETEWAIDPNKHLYVEADRLYMFAANGHMGFNGESALSALLSSDTATGWGPWHESGHQRQISPMTWDTGSGMTEVTVNLYSLATQENLEGRASRLDVYDPFIKQYLSLPSKDFNAIPDAFHKVIMLWQLRLTFGTSFYPQLHQRYRMMQDPPSKSDDKAQRFIVETSLLSNTDLSSFFDEWGLYSTLETLLQTNDLPLLTQPIWTTDSHTTFPLPMPVQKYIPELAHILLDISADFRGKRFSVDKQWFWTFRYEFTKNGNVVAWVDRGQCVNCNFAADGRMYVNCDVSSAPDELWTVQVIFDKAPYTLASSNITPLLLMIVKDLFADEHCRVIKPSVDQRLIDFLMSGLDMKKTGELAVLLRRAQRLYLHTITSRIETGYIAVNVTFEDGRFRQYDYVMRLGSASARLLKGHAYDSELNGYVWTQRANFGMHETISLTASTPSIEQPLLLFAATLTEQQLIDRLAWLFTDATMTHLQFYVDQAMINENYERAQGSFTNSGSRATYLSRVNIAQVLLLKKTIAKVVRTTDSLYVYFEGETFKNHNYKLFVNEVYASEVTQGEAYYSNVSNGVWSSVGIFDRDDHCKVSWDYKDATHILYESKRADTLSLSSEAPYADVTYCDHGL
ncbi:M60 family metallopeptidase [Pseudomonas syringae]|uniref:M60 family metallopeptidase n=1 Tax=Pseudomonas syringae TaxID=317 RepID=UPI000402261A|nr:M60 family metallopeptidase [Pseudomonas syringae]